MDTTRYGLKTLTPLPMAAVATMVELTGNPRLGPIANEARASLERVVEALGAAA